MESIIDWDDIKGGEKVEKPVAPEIYIVRHMISELVKIVEKEPRMKIICVDMDGTIAQGVSWTPEECARCKPELEIIEQVNKLFLENFIVIYTARRDHLLPATLEWLRRNGVHFQAISNFKIASDFYVDDKAVLPADAKNL